MDKGKVWLVGAGPGDKELLTIKGKKCLADADVVIYDLLVCPSLLNLTRDDCELIFAGKQSGNHFKKQGETNMLMVELAMQGKSVVRLKGGDPYVFGRGGEEAEELGKHGIEFEIVPGVSSCYSAAAYAGIPVTHRDYASSFHVITGHRKNSSEELDFKTLAALDGTQVYLMSLNNLNTITSGLISHGKSPETPAAVISCGTTACQKTVISTLESIAENTKKLKTPALTVVGDVVSLHDVLGIQNDRCLNGIKVIVTGTKKHSEKMADCLKNYGAETAEISILGIKPVSTDKLLEIDWDNFSWIVFTSMNGVQVFFDLIAESEIDLRKVINMKFASIGRGTAEELKRHGIHTDVMPEKYESRYLADVLIPKLTADDNVLLMRAENGTTVLQDMFKEHNKKYEVFPLYKTETVYGKRELLQLNLKDADYVILSSASAAKAYGELTDGLCEVGARIISIGDVTTSIAKSLGIYVTATALNASPDDVAAAIIHDVSKRSGVDVSDTY